MGTILKQASCYVETCEAMCWHNSYYRNGETGDIDACYLLLTLEYKGNVKISTIIKLAQRRRRMPSVLEVRKNEDAVRECLTLWEGNYMDWEDVLKRASIKINYPVFKRYRTRYIRFR